MVDAEAMTEPVIGGPMTNNKNHVAASSAISPEETPTISPIIGEGACAHRLVRVGAWSFTAHVGDDEPRIRDIDLAERLGYERPRAIRDLIERMVSGGKLKDSALRRTARQTAGRPAEEFWLTEAQALKVIAKSETATADAILDEVIHVFMLARRGLLGAFPATVEGMAMALRPIIDQSIVEATAPIAIRVGEQMREIVATREESAATRREMVAIRETNDKILGAFAELARAFATGHALAIDTNKGVCLLAARDGTITGEEADKLRDKVARIVEIRAAQSGVLGDRGAMQSIRNDVYNDLHTYIDWGRRGQALGTMPAAKVPFAKAHLDYQLRKLLTGKPKGRGASKASKQEKLFDDKPN